MLDEALKKCRKCGNDKPLSAFYRQSNRPDGRHTYCKQCFDAGHNRKPESPESKRRQNLKRRYGISVEDFDALLASQGGKCAICGDVPQRPCVDHCHATGAVRGILCHRCNVAIAILDNELLRARALEYLKK